MGENLSLELAKDSRGREDPFKVASFSFLAANSIKVSSLGLKNSKVTLVVERKDSPGSVRSRNTSYRTLRIVEERALASSKPSRPPGS
jgi:hypothetical protein